VHAKRHTASTKGRECERRGGAPCMAEEHHR